MTDRSQLMQTLENLLQAARFKDYCPNGLQVEGTPTVRSLVSGVTASLALIEAAVAVQADTLLVHHGLFWRGQDGRITGWLKQRLSLLLAHNINLIAYLPSRGEKNNYRNANIFDGAGSYLEEKTAKAAIQYFENVAHYIRMKNVYANVMSEPRAIREMTAGFTKQALEWYNTTRKSHPDFLSRFITFSEAFFNRFVGEFFLKVLCRRLTPNYHTHTVGRGYQSILDFVLEVRQLINRIEIIHSMCTSIRVQIPEPRVIYEMLVVALPSQACEKAKIHIRSMLAFQTVREECDPILFMETIEKLARESIAEVRLRDPPPIRAPVAQPRVASVQEAQLANENTHEMMQELGTASLEVRYEAVINCLSNISGYEDIEDDAASLEALERICAAKIDDQGCASEGFCVPVIDQHGVLAAMTNPSGKSLSVTCWACGESGHLARDCKKNDGSLAFRPSSSTSAPFKDVLRGKKAAGFTSRGRTPFSKSS